MANRMTRIKATAIILLAAGVLGGLAYGALLASRSPLFLIKVVEFDGDTALSEGNGLRPALESAELQRLADIPVGEVSLFDLDLDVVRERLIAHEWIRDVALRKVLPDTISISVRARQPVALMRSGGGGLVYVDESGEVFGKVDATVNADLPVFAPGRGFPEEELKQAVRLIEIWNDSNVGAIAKISALAWEAGRGYRALIVYPFMHRDGVGRSMVELGQIIDVSLEMKMERVAKVLKYLVDHSLVAARIWVGDGKKIVVRTTRGS